VKRDTGDRPPFGVAFVTYEHPKMVTAGLAERKAVDTHSMAKPLVHCQINVVVLLIHHRIRRSEQ
jgi:hypothetical protein